MARELIQLSGDVNPREFKDEYRRALKKIIRKKINTTDPTFSQLRIPESGTLGRQNRPRPYGPYGLGPCRHSASKVPHQTGPTGARD